MLQTQPTFFVRAWLMTDAELYEAYAERSRRYDELVGFFAHPSREGTRWVECELGKIDSQLRTLRREMRRRGNDH